MSSPRMPIRLLEDANIASAYPRELVANFTSGDLTLVGPNGTSQVKIPGSLTREVSGTGNGVTDITVSGHKVTITKGNFLTAHPTITKGTDTTGSTTLAYSGSFSAIDSITRDDNGHVTKISTKTITIPAAPTSVTGNAGTATKLAEAKNITLSGAVSGSASFDGSADAEIEVADISAGNITGLAGVATSGSYNDLSDTPALKLVATSGSYNDLSDKPTIPAASTVAGANAGTAAVGTSTAYARADHVHPAQTSVTGTAGSAAEFTAAKAVTLTGDVTGTASSKAGWSVATTLSNSGVTAGSYGQAANATPAHGGSFSIPKVTVDAKGRVTGASNITITLPGESNVGVTVDGTGNAVTAITQNGHGITVTKGATFLTAHPTITKSTDSTSTGTPDFGGTFTVVDSVTRDGNGHVTKINTKTVTLPDAPDVPTITIDSALSDTSTNAVQNKVVTTALNGKAASSHTHSYAGSSSAGGAANSVKSSMIVKLNGGTTEDTNMFTFNGASAKTVNITAAAIGAATSGHTHTLASLGAAASDHTHTLASLGAAAASHTHNYAGSSSAGGAANSVKASMVVKLNGGTTEDTNLFTFNGSDAKTVNITAAAIGAAAASHTHSYAGSSSAGGAASSVAGALTISLNGTSQGAYNGSAAKSINITPAAIGAAAASHSHSYASTVTYSATIGTSWSGSAAPYTQAISVSGITASDNPIVDVKPSDTYATGKSQVEAWGSIYRIVTSANAITVYANDKTTTAIPIQLKCVR